MAECNHSRGNLLTEYLGGQLDPHFIFTCRTENMRSVPEDFQQKWGHSRFQSFIDCSTVFNVLRHGKVRLCLNQRILENLGGLDTRDPVDTEEDGWNRKDSEEMDRSDSDV
ncbi:D-lysergyl-peptide-synthetase subunit 3 [Frankliniella fusca]|uniref:D-lysergyl-peptide-synthetase subunit 3 n=1 Tax=Frankliniella fusca TaxID=407009 RepID=A0AAE1HRA2_9NEOP|nr:D-lysergyl-peptide-synthetase subunit 3 [Frankliniella fusca]